MAADIDVRGRVVPGWEPVREAFVANFADHGEIGAACTVYADGQPVVDVWGGLADGRAGTSWEEDTKAVTFSTTKGVTAVVVNSLVERGVIDLDAPVVECWPEFGAAGKAEVPVRWLLTHQAGLPAVDRLLTPAELFAWDPMVEALAAQAPFWEPGSAHGYHAVTFGSLVGEVVRRITGRTLGTCFADDIARPLGLEYHIGLPADLEPTVARLAGAGQPVVSAEEAAALPADVQAFARAMADRTSLTYRAFNPTTPALRANSEAYHRAEMPAANGIGTARSLARMYAATIGEVDGIRLLSPATVAAATRPQTSGADRVSFRHSLFGLGFTLPSEAQPFTGPTAFGHPGMGGSLGFADAELGLGFGYVMNHMRADPIGDPRTRRLIAAVLSSRMSP